MQKHFFRAWHKNPVQDIQLGIALLLSLMLHGIAITIVSLTAYESHARREEIMPVSLVEFTLDRGIQPVAKRTEPLARKSTKIEEVNLPEKRTAIEPVQRPSPAPTEPIPKPIDTTPPPPTRAEASAGEHNFRGETGGAGEGGGGNALSRDGVGVAAATSTTGGVGGNTSAGTGRDFGSSGLQAQAGVLRTNRAAKPIQTARAAYPPMALRAGLEADVQLKIDVDPQGNVIRAEIIKSGGTGFDEEALRAVRQSRFEPAQKDGQYVAAEFTYVYRFRLRR
jgi:TonB family protein